ncbi:MAG TPA: cytochrome c3 family protein [Thermoanaerobaculia bacterium]|nr:cytochrome c3 family protein [Thermoanaerobaculia bacterium]
MRRNVSLGLALSCLVATFALAHYPATVKIDTAAKKQPPVSFNHAKHGDTLVKSCDTCHHTNKGLTKAQTDKVDVKKCSECHLEAKGKVPSMREMSLTKNPMHIRCLNCHKEQKKGPTACTGCHVKK